MGRGWVGLVAMWMAAGCLSDASLDEAHVKKGREITIEQAPWQVYYRRGVSEGMDPLIQESAQVEGNRYNWRHRCGGSIVAPQWILTSRHCVPDEANDVTPNDDGSITAPAGGSDDWLIVFAGSTYLTGVNLDASFSGSFDSDAGQARAVDKLFIIDDFDAAFLHLVEPLQINGVTTAVVPIITSAQDALVETPGTIATASGWGSLRWDGDGRDKPDHLMALDYAVDEESASNMHGPILGEGQNLDTAAPESTGETWAFDLRAVDPDSGVCNGDSGGPLTILDADGEAVLVGITTFDSGPGDCTLAATFANLKHDDFQAQLPLAFRQDLLLWLVEESLPQ